MTMTLETTASAFGTIASTLESVAAPQSLEAWVAKRKNEVDDWTQEQDICTAIQADQEISSLVRKQRRGPYDHNIISSRLRTVAAYCGQPVADDLVTRYELGAKFGIFPYVPPPTSPPQGINICGRETRSSLQFSHVPGHEPCSYRLRATGHETEPSLFRVIRLKRQVSLDPSVWQEEDTLSEGTSLCDAWELICVLTGLRVERDFPMNEWEDFTRIRA